jgi:peptide/nickel transport system substrate-binding protein
VEVEMADRAARRLWFGIAAIVALAPACVERAAPATEGGTADTPVHGGTLVVAGPNDLAGMNGLTATEAYTQDLLLHALFLPVVSLGTHGEIEPALARDWYWEGDTAITFDLRTDVRWHDGRTTTAHDVAFTFERATDPETGYPNVADFSQWTGVHAIDSFTVRFTMRPHIEPLTGLAFLPIMPAHALDSIAPALLAQAAFNRAPVGNGPFRFLEYRPNERWTFEANPDFPEELGGRPYLDRLVWRVIPENTAQVAELMTGAAHLILSPRADDLASIEAQAGLRTIVKPARQYHFIGWNGRTGPLAKPEVRRALTMALDRPGILEVVRDGRGELAAGPIGPCRSTPQGPAHCSHTQISPTATAMAGSTTSTARLSSSGSRSRRRMRSTAMSRRSRRPTSPRSASASMSYLSSSAH